MNLNTPSIKDFSDLLSRHDDKQNQRLVVNHNDDVEIICPSMIPPSVFEIKYTLYYEVWRSGNDYTGPDAAVDKRHV